MHATFLAPLNVVETAVERAGLDSVMNELAVGDRSVFVFRQTAAMTSVNGDPHAVMRIIGTLADDGQDCLMSAS